MRWFGLLAVGLMTLAVAGAFAQDLSEDELRRAQAQLDQLSAEDRQRVLEAAGLAASPEPPASTDTGLENLSIDDRVEPRAWGDSLVTELDTVEAAREELPIFGRNFFDLAPATFSPPSYGPVPADYEIGPGDELVVEVWGEVSFRDSYGVDRRGTVLLRDAGVVSVMGLTLEQARLEIATQFARVYSGIRPGGGGTTHVDVSLGKLRAIRVFVVGEARRPGGYEVSSVSTIFAALYAAGGPNDIGSLRDIQLIRGNRVIARLDVYQYLLRGVRGNDAVLREGDTVMIPVSQKQVTVAGEVRRPARFELKHQEDLFEAIEFAGGLLPSARSDLCHISRILPSDLRTNDQSERVQVDAVVPTPRSGPVSLYDGDWVTVLPVSELEEDYVVVHGSVRLPGRYAFDEQMTISDLVTKAGGVWHDAILERALLVRTRSDYSKQSFRIALREALAQMPDNLPLVPLDSLVVFSQTIMDEDPLVSIFGEVRSPGKYPLFEGMTLRDLVLSAGGLLDSAEPLKAEVSRIEPKGRVSQPDTLATILEVELGQQFNMLEDEPFFLQENDQVFIRRRPYFELQRNVLVRGEVKYPGSYTLRERDERLVSVLQRAGGLLDTAFVPGFRLSRTAGEAGNIGLDLNSAFDHPDGANNIILMDRDEMEIPSIPLSVKVDGEVGFPTSVIYEQGKGLSHYIDNAGGYTDQADKGRTKVVYPNGLSKKVKKFWGNPEVVPGSTVHVPRKEEGKGFDWGEFALRFAQVSASIATLYLVIDAASN